MASIEEIQKLWKFADTIYKQNKFIIFQSNVIEIDLPIGTCLRLIEKVICQIVCFSFH